MPRATLAISVIAATISACGGSTDPSQPGIRDLVVAFVAVSQSATTISAGETVSFSAVARAADNTLIPAKTFAWTAAPSSVATITSAGIATAVGAGTATITASVDGKSGNATLTVTPGGVTTVTLSSPTAFALIGQKTQFTAAPKDALGFPVPGRPVAWNSINPAIASVSTTGEVTAVSAGTTTITATIDGVVGSSPFEVRFLPLEIHQINVGWGSSVFLRGPDGTTMLLEAGRDGHGNSDVVPYLQSIGVPQQTGLSYTIAGHQHCDHIGGLDEVVQAGYGVRTRNYYNGSTETSGCVTDWNTAARSTPAGDVAVPAVGAFLSLGNGAKLTFVAVNGNIIGGGSIAVSDENDRSIAVLVQYGGFDYLWGSDLGGGDADNACTGRSTGQKDVESLVIQAISPGGAAPLLNGAGLDVLYVNHHGSESSTNSALMNLARPQVATIGVGAGQSSNFQFPRKSVVEKVLLAMATACVTAPPAFVLQGEEGASVGVETSFAGFNVGDIKISTTSQGTFVVSGTGRVTQGPVEVTAAGLPRTFNIDRIPAAPVSAQAGPSSRVRRPEWSWPRGVVTLLPGSR